MTALILAIATKIGVPGALLLSICAVETNLKNINNFEDGEFGSLGVCQVSPQTAKLFGRHYDSLSLQQPIVNIKIAAKYLKKQLLRYKNNTILATAAYNSGTAKFNKNGKLINEAYVNRVLKVYKGVKK